MNSACSSPGRSPTEDEWFLAISERILARRNPEKLVQEAAWAWVARVDRVVDAIIGG
jgi:hypothetical protein